MVRVDRILSVAVAAVVMTTVFAGVASATGQRWYFGTDAAPPTATGTCPDNLGYATPIFPASTVVPPAGAKSDIKLWQNQCAIFLASAPAQLTFDFGTDVWPVKFERKTGSHAVTISIGKMTPANAFVSYGQASFQLSGGSACANPCSGTVTATDMVIEPGETLAFRYQKSTTGSLELTTNSADTYVETPASDPGYPLPELGSLVLIGAGILGLAAFVLRRRRA